MINQEITALVLCLDYDDAMDMRLPNFVKIDPNLKVDPESENPIYKDKILDHMIY